MVDGFGLTGSIDFSNFRMGYGRGEDVFVLINVVAFYLVYKIISWENKMEEMDLSFDQSKSAEDILDDGLFEK